MSASHLCSGSRFKHMAVVVSQNSSLATTRAFTPGGMRSSWECQETPMRQARFCAFMQHQMGFLAYQVLGFPASQLVPGFCPSTRSANKSSKRETRGEHIVLEHDLSIGVLRFVWFKMDGPGLDGFDSICQGHLCQEAT